MMIQYLIIDLELSLKKYDLEYVTNKNYYSDFLYYMINETFQSPKYYTEPQTLKKNIDKDFYCGFYNE